MSFGAHLDELRIALFKCVIVMVLCFFAGLYFSKGVVDYIQTPLKASLTKYYEDKEVADLAERIAKENDRETASEEDKEKAAAAIANNRLLHEERFIDLNALLYAIEQQHPDLLPGDNHGKPYKPGDTIDKSKLLKLMLYYPSSEDPRVRVIGLSVIEAFMMYIKAAFLVGLLLASPFLFFFIWQFVAAGLYPHERYYVYIFMPFSLVLFISGVCLAFFAVLKFVLDFLFTFNASMGIDPDPRIGEWVSFVLMLPIGFGIAFQLPLVMLFLNRIGVFSVQNYIEKWRLSVLIIAVSSAILTPADPTSMVFLCVPLIFLYFGGIMLCKYLPKQTTEFGNEVE